MDRERFKNIITIGTVEENSTIYQDRAAEKYLAYATKDRGDGHCHLWIITKEQNCLEYFELNFNREGIVVYRSAYGKKNIESIFDKEHGSRIAYTEALQLLGDAARQNYKYEHNLEMIERINSLHLERC